jgi:hypothetical protein
MHPDPLNQTNPWLRSGLVRNQKGLGPLEKPREMPHCVLPAKKNNIRTFKIRGTLIVTKERNGNRHLTILQILADVVPLHFLTKIPTIIFEPACQYKFTKKNFLVLSLKFLVAINSHK